MIKFFRRIRKDLMESGKTATYLKYAIGEILLVVLGILIALSINNWNENKKLSGSETQYLRALKEEFTYNKEELTRAMNRNSKNIESTVELVANMGPGISELTEKELGRLMAGSLSREIQFNPNQGVIDEIINSGKLGLFKNQELKFALSAWNGLMQSLRLQEAELHRLRYITIDIIRNEANLRKAISGPGLEARGIFQSKFEKGNLGLLKSLSFEGHMVGIATMSTSLNTNDYSKIAEEIDRILALIDTEIE